MTWMLFALLPPLFWTLGNYIDQYVSRKWFSERTLSCVTYESIISVFYIPVFILIKPDVLNVSFQDAVIVMIGGLFPVLSGIPYYLSLKERDASLAIPMFQTIPIFTCIIGWLFFGETLSGMDIIGGLIIIVSAMAMLWDFHAKTFSYRPFFLMLLASFFYAMHYVVMRFTTFSLEWYQIAFWVIVSWSLVGIILILTLKDTRVHILKTVYEAKGIPVLWNLLQQSFQITATIGLVTAVSLAPTTTHVPLINGLQPFFLVVIGGILGHFFPKWIEKAHFDRILLIKLSLVTFIFLGIYLLTV